MNPFDKYRPDLPPFVSLEPGQELFIEMESKGLQELSKVGLVLIAGGLGERLGFSGIKVSLPVVTIVQDYSYIRYYCEYIHAI